jgi:DNA-binding NarL/FixJ family response regulator
MQALAVACATILYMIEQTLLVCRQQHTYDLQRCAFLTKKEREVLTCMGQGLNREEIATALVIRPVTVKTHRQRIFEKLGVKSDSDAIMMGYSVGLFSPIEHLVRPEPNWPATPAGTRDAMS